MHLVKLLSLALVGLFFVLGICTGSTHNEAHKHLRTVDQMRETHRAAESFRMNARHHAQAHGMVHIGERFAQNPVHGRRTAPRTGGIMSHAIDSTPHTRVRHPRPG